MYLLIYPSLGESHPQRRTAKPARALAACNDFITPDGLVVPRAAGEAALLGHTAVLVGGLFVGIWSQL